MAFTYYEIVRVTQTDDPAREGIVGLEGAVLGISSEDDGEVVGYGVFVYELGRTGLVLPSELEATGRHDRRETFYDGSVLRVSPGGDVFGFDPAPGM